MDRITIGIAAGGLASFALLYAPQPVLPQLAHQFQVTLDQASLVVGVATGALALGVIPLSLLSEVAGRRPVVLLSVVVAIVLGLVLPFVSDFHLLVGLRALQGLALAGFPAVAMAYLAEQGRVKAIGMLVAGNTFGGMVGRLAAGLTGSTAPVAILAAAAAGVLIWALPRNAEQTTTRAGISLSSAVRRPILWALYAVAFLGMGSFVALYNAIGFRLAAPPLEVSPQVASLVFVAYAIGGVNSATLGRRAGRQKVLFGMLGLTTAGALITIPAHVVPIAIGFVLLTAGWFAAHAAAGAWVNVVAPHKGPASGLYTGAYYAGASVGGTAGTAVYAAWGWTVLVSVSVCWLSLSASGVWWISRRRKTLSSAKNLSRNTGAPLAR
ncbi:YNFM family putative membrane transporter [Kibdelosporangium banguiense]|uniref:YNFM family putative membrane transporter n=1 Tax=Kibdelosporangium banguiense TaxID=1365924 RepID=A0ABS4T8P6_9PSEU|nr:MFS transporter [Kibdelosporangium banguiense]MBP2320758.1 YNFM family putative membrane transporter [Kibdelosporangium banguiense]